MPKIRRWFNTSHDINFDPEVWELTERLGDRALRVWLEILSMADRNDGMIPGWGLSCSPELGRSLASRCRVTGQTLASCLRFFDEKLWTIPGEPHRVRNHAKFRPSREANKIPPGKQTVTPPHTPHTPTNIQYSTVHVPDASHEEEGTAKAEVVDLSVSEQNGQKHAPKKPWPDDASWLREFLTSQRHVSTPNGTLLDYPWWEQVSITAGGLNLDTLETEFARMGAWLQENRSRAPASAMGWKRFVRRWLERHYERERKGMKYAAQAKRYERHTTE